jgi:type I restriction enzyme S subunit
MQKLQPKLRFPEFKEEWEKDIIGNVCDISSGGTPSRSNNTFWDGEIPWVSTSLIDFNTITSTDEYITELGLKNSSAKLFPKGTILMAMYGQGKTRGKVSVLGIEASTNQACGAIIPKSEDLNYIYLFQNLSKRYDEIRDLSNQGGQENLSGGIIKSLEITFPSLPEQTKIASFLSTVDEKINLLKKQLTLLEQYKKGVMQKIFSREIRFKDEEGNEFPEWEERKVSDIFRITRGNVLSVTKMELQEKNEYCYPVFSSQTKNGGVCGFYNEYLFENAITWTTDGANAGEVNYRKGKFYCTNVCGVLLSKEGYANECIAEILNSITKKYVSYVGNPKLMNNVIANISFLVPSSIYEQHKISSFLNSIDDKINKTQDQISKMELWKKGLLQQMFV